MHEPTMIAQKRRLQVILDLECYDDLDLQDLDWTDILGLDGDESVHVTIKDSYDIY